MARMACLDCGKLLNRTAAWSGTKRCHACADATRRGRHLNEEHRKKIGLAHLGKRRPPETGEKISRAKMGHSVSAETRAKIGAVAMGRPSGNKGRRRPHTAEELVKMRGPNHWCYRDGLGSEPYVPNWGRVRQEIVGRDGGLCQHPGCYLPENGKSHECHHIDRDKKNNRPSNLILLCHQHHGKTKRGNMESWQELYEAVQAMRGIA